MDGDSEVESEDEDDDMDDDEVDSNGDRDHRSAIEKALDEEANSLKPFANETEASKSLRNYTRQSVVNVDKDLVLTSSGLNIVKTILPRTLQLMTLSRGNHAFDLFLQLTRVCQVYLYTVLCMYNTCHPCSYEEESIHYQKRLENQFEALFGDFDFKENILKPPSRGDNQTSQAVTRDASSVDMNNLSTE